MQNPIGRALRHRHAGEDSLAWALADLAADENFDLTSSAFAHAGPIPALYRGRILGANISPPLNWTAPPAASAELLLIVQDRDVPFARPATHALAAGIEPSLLGLPDNALSRPSPIAGLTFGKGALGKLGWAGPMPIPSHGPHSYVFQLFALDTRLGLGRGFDLAAAIAAMTGHVIGRARLDGTYEVQ